MCFSVLFDNSRRQTTKVSRGCFSNARALQTHHLRVESSSSSIEPDFKDSRKEVYCEVTGENDDQQGIRASANDFFIYWWQIVRG